MSERAFVKAWNQLICRRLRCSASFARIASGTEDPLLRYRAKEMVQLLIDGQRVAAFDYRLSLKTIDHIEVTPEGKLRVIFLTGTKITF